MGKRNQSESQLANLEKGTRFHGEIARRAQEKSTEAKKKYRPLKEIAKEKLDEDTWNEILASMIEKARHGDPKAFELLRDTIGEKPSDRLELAGEQDLQVNITVRD